MIQRRRTSIIRYSNIFDEIANFEALYKAYEECIKGRRYKNEVVSSTAHIEMIVSDLVRELQEGTYKPGEYYEFETRKEVKRRIIHAPLFRDRIVQHAVCNVLEPLYEKKFIFDSYANRKGKGNHKAVARVQLFLYQGRCNNYVLQGDFKKYYDNVDHELLKAKIRHTVKDERVLLLCDALIDSYNGHTGKGIPIGAPFSQLMANVNLDSLDHFAKEVLRVKKYVRLMDDFVIIGHKDDLIYYLQEIQWYADTQLKQPLNPKTQIYPANHGIDFGGYRTFANKILPRKRNVKAAKKRLKAVSWLYRNGVIDERVVKQQINSFKGYMSHCDGNTTLKNVLSIMRK